MTVINNKLVLTSVATTALLVISDGLSLSGDLSSASVASLHYSAG